MSILIAVIICKPRDSVIGVATVQVEYCADIKLLISCGSDGQVVLSDVDQGCKKGDSLRHRSDVHDFVWLRRFIEN